MHPVVRALGKVLQLVGISSPEDAQAKQPTEAGLPSWRKDVAARAEALEQEKRAEEKQAGE